MTDICWTCRILSTSAGTDTFLLTVNYALLTLTATLDMYSRRRVRQTALAVAEKASAALLPGETLIATITEDSSSRLGRASERLHALTGLISDFRVFARLWGLLRIWEWGADVWNNPPADGVLKMLVWGQVIMNVAYQWLENGAYLAQHGVLGWSEARQAKAWLWSSRFWAAHIVLEFGRLLRVRAMSLRDAEAKSDSTQEKEAKIARIGSGRSWWRQVYVNAAYAPLTVHWSLESGIMGDLSVGVLGSVAGLIGLQKLWNETT